MMTTLTKPEARRIWIRAQKLDQAEPFGFGPEAVEKAVAHLGYVQIDTINVIERCHHHILYSRIPQYRRRDLHDSQTVNKSIFEYWTHALSYIPTQDYRYFIRDMRRRERDPGQYLSRVKVEDWKKVLRLIRNQGAISIREITDDVLVEKDHDWASKKPSKRALQLGFHTGKFTISERLGMLKKYELSERHFNWIEKPKPASEREQLNYMLDRALRSQGLISLDSICHLQPSLKPSFLKLINSRVRAERLIPIKLKDLEVQFWIRPEVLSDARELPNQITHILSPFDPLIIQRKRLKNIFDYEHLFEAYIPKEKRKYGYFALPVLMDDQIVAVLDLKTDRQNNKLLTQKWTWLDKHKSKTNKARIESELHRFSKFQLA